MSADGFSHDEDPIELLLERYLAGHATVAEAESVRSWLSADPSHVAILNDFRRILRIAKDRPPERSVDAAWARTFAAMSSGEAAGSDKRLLPPHAEARTRRVRSGPRWRYRDQTRDTQRHSLRVILAAAAVLVVVGVLNWERVQRVAAPSATAVPWKEAATQPGQRAILQLTDGSQVMLAPASRIRYAVDATAGARDVELVGQALFEVEHDASRPFRVYTQGAVSEDLGTEFVVTAYPEDSATVVTVASGRVSLWRSNAGAHSSPGIDPRTSTTRAALPTLVLEAGDVGQVNPSGALVATRGTDIEQALAWTTNALVFDNTSLADAARTLSRWYDLDIRVADPELAARPLSATFRSEPVSEVLDRIALALRLRVERNGRSVILHRRATSALPPNDTSAEETPSTKS